MLKRFWKSQDANKTDEQKEREEAGTRLEFVAAWRKYSDREDEPYEQWGYSTLDKVITELGLTWTPTNEERQEMVLIERGPRKKNA